MFALSIALCKLTACLSVSVVRTVAGRTATAAAVHSLGGIRRGPPPAASMTLVQALPLPRRACWQSATVHHGDYRRLCPRQPLQHDASRVSMSGESLTGGRAGGGEVARRGCTVLWGCSTFNGRTGCSGQHTPVPLVTRYSLSWTRGPAALHQPFELGTLTW